MKKLIFSIFQNRTLMKNRKNFKFFPLKSQRNFSKKMFFPNVAKNEVFFSKKVNFFIGFLVYLNQNFFGTTSEYFLLPQKFWFK